MARRGVGLAGLLAAGLLGAAAPVSAAEPAGCYVFAPARTTPPPPVSEAIGGRPVLRYLPPHPKGVIYLFHGTGGSERFATRLETVRTLAPLVAADYGYVAAPSADRVDPIRWKVDDASPANPDIAYMLALHRALIAKGEIDARTPVFTMGMSNGGSFANLYAMAARREGLPVAAVADYMGPFPASMRPALADPKALAPTLVVLSRNDGLVSTPNVSEIAGRLAAGGARVEMHVNEEHAVCAETFAVLPGLSPAARAKLVGETLPAAGIIDASGRRTVFTADKAITREDIQALVARLQPLPLDGAAPAREVANVLLIAWAAHQMRSDFADRQLAFFDAALPRPR